MDDANLRHGQGADADRFSARLAFFDFTPQTHDWAMLGFGQCLGLLQAIGVNGDTPMHTVGIAGINNGVIRPRFGRLWHGGASIAGTAGHVRVPSRPVNSF